MLYPAMRLSLVHYMKILADPVFQERHWTHGIPTNFLCSFNDIINFLFYDTGLNDEEEDSVGEILRDYNEATHVSAVIKAIDDLLDQDNSLTDAEYIAKPEWQGVLTAAQAALAVIMDPHCGPEGAVREAEMRAQGFGEVDSD